MPFGIADFVGAFTAYDQGGTMKKKIVSTVLSTLIFILMIVLGAVAAFFYRQLNYGNAENQPVLLLTMRVAYILNALIALFILVHVLVLALDRKAGGFELILGLLEAAFFLCSAPVLVTFWRGLFLDSAGMGALFSNTLLLSPWILGLFVGAIYLFLQGIRLLFFRETEVHDNKKEES